MGLKLILCPMMLNMPLKNLGKCKGLSNKLGLPSLLNPVLKLKPHPMQRTSLQTCPRRPLFQLANEPSLQVTAINLQTHQLHSWKRRHGSGCLVLWLWICSFLITVQKMFNLKPIGPSQAEVSRMSQIEEFPKPRKPRGPRGKPASKVTPMKAPRKNKGKGKGKGEGGKDTKKGKGKGKGRTAKQEASPTKSPKPKAKSQAKAKKAKAEEAKSSEDAVKTTSKRKAKEGDKGDKGDKPKPVKAKASFARRYCPKHEPAKTWHLAVREAFESCIHPHIKHPGKMEDWC